MPGDTEAKEGLLRAGMRKVEAEGAQRSGRNRSYRVRSSGSMPRGRRRRGGCAPADAGGDGPGGQKTKRSVAERSASLLSSVLERAASETEREPSPSQATSTTSSSSTPSSSLLATLGPLAGVALLLGFGFVFREPLQRVLVAFTESIDSMGAEGYVIYMLLYVLLEVLAIPAIPLTMTGGLLFGAIAGTAVVSICATAAATIAYLIARYVARDRVRKLVQGNKKFEAIDRAIGKDGFRVVTLLRLSPLLPLALSNYLYGLTSVPLRPYIAGTCIGMLPGTAAYVTAGSLGRAFILGSESGGGSLPGTWQKAGLGVGVAITAFSATYVARQARNQLQEIEQEAEEPHASTASVDEEAGEAGVKNARDR